jgi:hypothetical protein
VRPSPERHGQSRTGDETKDTGAHGNDRTGDQHLGAKEEARQVRDGNDGKYQDRP